MFLAAGVAAAAAYTAPPATAAEGGGAPYPPGISAVYQGVLPPFPGLYLLNQGGYFNLDRLVGPSGEKLPVSFHGHGFTYVPRFLYVYPVTLPGGGTLATQAFPVISNVNLRVGNVRDSATGVGAVLVTPLTAAWSIAPNTTAQVGLDFLFPIGKHRGDRLVNLSPGYTSFQPVFALRYNNPNGLDVGVNPRLAFNTQNDTTNYRSGNSLVLDFTAGWNFGNWKPGIVGGWWRQFTDDRVNGSSAPFNGRSGNRGQVLNIGPSLTYQAGPFSFNVNYQRSFFVRNTARSDTVYFNVAVPLSLVASKLFQ